jgi:hypothetical protein
MALIFLEAKSLVVIATWAATNKRPALKQCEPLMRYRLDRVVIYKQLAALGFQQAQNIALFRSR